MFARDVNVSVFETNIRVLGGLLSAHQLAVALQLDRYPPPPPPATGNDDDDDTKNIVLRGDVWDEQEQVRYGSIDLTQSPMERWWQYQHVLHHGDDDAMTDPPPEVCATRLDTTFGTTVSDHPPATMSPCFDRSLSSSSTCPLPFTTPAPSFLLPLLSASTVCPVNVTWATGPIGNHTIRSTKTSPSRTIRQIPPADLWIYDGFLLELALDIGQRLLPAFSTPTGIPYGTVNLLYGVPPGETTVASLAGGGTLSVEMELLSRLSGDTRFGKAAKLASRALFRYRSLLDLFGKHIDIQSGVWVETLSGIGSNSDSYLEYLAKHYMLFPEDDDFWIMFKAAYAGVFNESRVGEWYADVDMNFGVSSGQSRAVFESLAAFYPGLQVLLGEIAPAARSLNSMFMVREVLGFLPERFNYGIWNLDHNRGGAGIHPLRPELLESNYLMHRATRGVSSTQLNGAGKNAGANLPTSGWQWAADYALHKLAVVTQARCGFAGIHEVKQQTTGLIDGTINNNAGIAYIDEMPSFFLSETLKYLYLTFDDDNILHQGSEREWIFTTEAHPVHYEPQKSTSSSSLSNRRELTRNIAAIKASLQRRLSSADKGTNINATLLTKYDTSFFRGRRTKVVNDISYREDVQNVISTRSLHRLNIAADQIFQFVPVGHFLQDVFRESERKSNVANLALGNWGSGMRLQKNCLNIYSSDFLWMHALSGGATDYSDTYVSTGRDTLLEDPHFFTMFGAADALGSLGVGTYVGERDTEGGTCPIYTFSTEPATLTVDQINAGNTSSIIASEVGNFEITADGAGAGFQVRHMDNEETIKATIVYGESPSDSSIAIVNSDLCTKGWTLTTTPDADGNIQVVREKRRRSSIADFNGNSFSCEIKLISAVDAETETSDRRKETIHTTVPCTPAAFGPTQISQLLQQGSIIVDAKLFGPQQDNPLGCNKPTGSAASLIEDELSPSQASEKIGNEYFVSAVIGVDTHSWKANSIHMVHRGECNFFSKAINMYKTWNVDALIVVSSSEEMFMMSSSPEEMEKVDPIEIPISVMVSKQDGEVLLDKVNRENSIQSQPIFARIEITQSLNSANQGEVETTQIRWPIIQGTNNVLQIMTELGWGVHAEHKTDGQYQEWQVSIMKHSIDNQG